MPINAYFKGDGSEVMASMQKRYGQKGGTSAFYATANKLGMKPKSHLPPGTMLTPRGDIGKARQRESQAVGGFKCAMKGMK